MVAEKALASLLALPQELRDQVLSYVLFSSRRDVPAEPTEYERRRRSQTTQMAGCWSNGLGIMCEDEIQCDIPGPALLATCRKLNADATLLLSKARSRDAYLDILLVNEDELWPTWTSLPPVPTREVDTLHITFRASGAVAFRDQGTAGPSLWSKWVSIGTGQEPMASMFCAMLERCLVGGIPGMAARGKEQPQPGVSDSDKSGGGSGGITVRTIKINVQSQPDGPRTTPTTTTTPDPEKTAWYDARTHVFGLFPAGEAERTRLRRMPMPAPWLLDCVAREIMQLVAPARNLLRREYGQALVERVAGVEFALDGVPVTAWEPVDVWAELVQGEQMEARGERAAAQSASAWLAMPVFVLPWAELVSEVAQRRKENGLPCGET